MYQSLENKNSFTKFQPNDIYFLDNEKATDIEIIEKVIYK